jgi:hypothetical protein
MFSYFSPFKQLLLKKSLKSIDKTTNDESEPKLETNKTSVFVEDEDTVKDDDTIKDDDTVEDEDTVKDDDTIKDDDTVEDKKEKREEDACIILKGIPFYYLDNSTDINRDMSITSYLKEQNITNIEVHIGIHKINKTNYAPFLTYGLAENKKLLSFPHFTYEILNGSSDKEEEEEEEPCIEECKLQILSLFNIYPDSNIHKINDFFNKKMIYNGYIHTIDELLIVFEYKEEQEDDNKLQWATIHEIVNTKKIIQQPIPILYKWFLQFPDLMYMTDKYDTVIDIPFILYSLSKSEDTNTFHTVTNSNSVLPPFIYYPKFGMKYFFSNNYIDENPIPLQRYVVFLTKTLYILDETKETTESISKFNSIYFQQDGEPIWAVSSVDFFSKLH